jgi:lysophospholipase L1-like esterase
MERMNIIKPGTFSVAVAADSRRDEFDCKNEVMIINRIPVDLVFIGDSIIHKWELNAYFRGMDIVVLNRGIGGDTSEYLSKRFEADVLQLRPGYCVLMIGINDIWSMSAEAIEAKSNKPDDIVNDSIVRNFSHIIDMAVKNNQRTVICSILPTNIRNEPINRDRNKYISILNTFIEDICKNNGIIYIDFHTHFVSSDGITLKDGLSADGLHPNVFGYNLMADVLLTTLIKNGVRIRPQAWSNKRDFSADPHK